MHKLIIIYESLFIFLRNFYEERYIQTHPKTKTWLFEELNYLKLIVPRINLAHYSCFKVFKLLSFGITICDGNKKGGVYYENKSSNQCFIWRQKVGMHFL